MKDYRNTVRYDVRVDKWEHVYIKKRTVDVGAVWGKKRSLHQYG